MKKETRFGLFLFFFAYFLSAAGVYGQRPAPVSNILLVDDFDQAFSANQLGGAYGLVAEGGQAQFQFIQPAVPYLANNSALKINYELTSSPGYAFLWMKLGKHKDTHEQTEYLNLNDFVFLSFKYKSPQDIHFKVEIHEDLDGDGRFNFASDRVSFVYTNGVKRFDLGGGWHKVLIPLKRFGGIKDWSKILEMVFVFEKDRVGKSGEVLLEDLLFIRKELKKASPAGADKVKNVQVAINDAPAVSHATLNGKNHITLSYEPAEGFEDIESVALELRANGNESWTPVVTEFNPGENQTDLVWETYTFSPPDQVALRIVASDFLGQNRILAGPFEELKIPALTDEKFLDLTQQKAFLYFLDNQHAESGLFYDTTGGGDLSIAVTGFGLTAFVIGVERGWMDREEAKRRTIRCLDSFLNKVEGHEGFYYHFVNAQTLKRAGTSEVSTVDTALLLTGALTAGEYFGGDVKKKAEEIYKRANWNYFLNKNENEEHYLQFHHGWTPEEQLADNYWDYYTEETLLLDLLGIGAPKHEVPAEVFYKFVRRKGQYKEGTPFIVTWHGGLFSYQYASAWYDYRNIVDREGVNWYENSKQATLANREFVIDHATEYKTYGPDSWGITSMRVPERYVMHYGPVPNGQNLAEHDGSIAPSGAGGSLMFTPYHSLRVLKYLYNHHPDVWGTYGFKDSLNVDRNWISPIYYGLGQGILLLSIENFRSGLVWQYFMKNKHVKKGLEKTKFKKQQIPSPLETYQKLKQETDSLEKKLAQSEKSGDWVVLAKQYAKLLESLQVDHVETARVYLVHGESYKKTALNYFDKALATALLEGHRLEILRQKMDIINGVMAFEERDALQDQIAQELKSGIKKGAYNLAWVLKWAEQLDEDTALKIRREFHSDLPPAARKVLYKAIEAKAAEAFKAGDFRKAALLTEEQIEFMEEEKDKTALVKFLQTTAKSFAEVQKFAESEKFYNRLMELATPQEVEAVQASFAKMLETKGDKERAIQEYQKLIKNFPASEHVPEALSRMANIHSSLGQREKAVELLQKIITGYSSTPHAEEANYLLGMIYYHNSQYAQAIKTWEGFLEQYPDSRRGQVVKDYLEKADRKEAEDAIATV